MDSYQTFPQVYNCFKFRKYLQVDNNTFMYILVPQYTGENYNFNINCNFLCGTSIFWLE